MPEKKNTQNSRPAAKKNTRPAAKTPAKASAKATAKTQKKEPVQKEMPMRPLRDENSMLHRILPYIFVVCAVLIGVCFIFSGGALGKGIHDFFLGTLGLVSVLLPFLLLYFAACWRGWVADGQHALKCIFAVGFVMFGGALVQLIMVAPDGDAH